MNKQMINKMLAVASTLTLILTVCSEKIDVSGSTAITSSNIETGKIGENITYILDNNTGLLTLNGVGIMEDVEIGEGNPEEYSSIFSSKVKKIIINEGIRTIGDYIFKDCISLVDVCLPTSLVHVGESAFEGCISLTEIDFSKNVMTIEGNAFKNCTSLNTVTIYNVYCEIRTNENIENLKKIIGYNGSTAQTFAEENGIEFETLGISSDKSSEHEFGDIFFLNVDICNIDTYRIDLTYKTLSESRDNGRWYEVQISNNKQFVTDDEEGLLEGDLRLGLDENVCFTYKRQSNKMFLDEDYSDVKKCYVRVRFFQRNVGENRETIYWNWSEVIEIELLDDESTLFTEIETQENLLETSTEYKDIIIPEITVKEVSNPKSTKIKSLNKAKKSLKVTWKKVKNINGYQLQYSMSKKFKNAKTITIKKAKTTSKTIKKLKSKKRYYVRIRTYKVVNGKKYYSKWSKTKSQKTK